MCMCPHNGAPISVEAARHCCNTNNWCWCYNWHEEGYYLVPGVPSVFDYQINCIVYLASDAFLLSYGPQACLVWANRTRSLPVSLKWLQNPLAPPFWSEKMISCLDIGSWHAQKQAISNIWTPHSCCDADWSCRGVQILPKPQTGPVYLGTTERAQLAPRALSPARVVLSPRTAAGSGTSGAHLLHFNLPSS